MSVLCSLYLSWSYFSWSGVAMTTNIGLPHTWSAFISHIVLPPPHTQLRIVAYFWYLCDTPQNQVVSLSCPVQLPVDLQTWPLELTILYPVPPVLYPGRHPHAWFTHGESRNESTSRLEYGTLFLLRYHHQLYINCLAVTALITAEMCGIVRGSLSDCMCQTCSSSQLAWCSVKLSREKTFANWWKIRFLRRKLSQIACLCRQKMPHPQILQRKVLQIATKPLNSQKFSPLKVSTCTAVL